MQYTVTNTAPEEIGIMYTDVEIAEIGDRKFSGTGAVAASAAITPASVHLSGTFPADVRIPVIEILDSSGGQLITAIEILSPVNKREPGLTLYREKRHQLHLHHVHLLEIDLLRRGERPFRHSLIPKSDYLITLARGDVNRTSIWAFNLRDSLPVVPVPLKAPDADAPLDLGAALREAYDRSGYAYSVDYRQTPPPPELSPEDAAWVQEQLAQRKEA